MTRRERNLATAVFIGCLLALTVAAPASGAFGYLSAFGTYGSGDGQFVTPKGIDVGPDGNLYIADSGNSRIQVVTPDGAFVRKWGTAGTSDGQFGRLLDVAVASPSGNVYTLEGDWGGAGYNQVQKFTSDGTFVTRWGQGGGYNGMWALDVDAAENVYVAETGGSRVVKFSSTGTQLTTWGTPGAGAGQFKQISSIAVDASGDVYTVEAPDGGSPNNDRVQKFDANGALQPDFGGASSFSIGTSDLWANPLMSGFDVDPSGSILMTGYHTLRFTSTGAPAERLLDCFGFGLAAHPTNGKVYTTNIGVLVFGEGGGTCQGKVPERLTFQGDESLTINAGAQYTNDPAVQLTVTVPGAATLVRISNDGGFATASSVPVAASRQYAWTLDSSGPERLPKTVYVRFSNETESSSQNFTDDIILDQTAPVIEGATATKARATLASLRAVLPVPTYQLVVAATDNVSGVAQMQVAADVANPGEWAAFTGSARMSTAGRDIFVRVRDGAGNVSEWRAVAADRAAPNTRIVRGPAKVTTSRRARFRFRANDANATFRCRIDKRAYRACRSPKTYRSVKRGRHVFRVRARDLAGNVDRTPAIRRWTVR